MNPNEEAGFFDVKGVTHVSERGCGGHPMGAQFHPGSHS